jgi:ubiquinone/menaquinone biosynthesis C-methylase UbiE
VTGDDEIAHYYGRGEELGRLEGSFRLEFARTQELLTRCLPDPPAVVLDVGGGPGVYAAWLAERGYEVHLLDPVELHVRQAREASDRIASAERGDARALPYADGTADAVLLLGPLYHLQEHADRRRALEEARRVLRPGGVLAAAAISRFASTIDGLRRGLLLAPVFEQGVERSLREGRHENPERVPERFTTAYFHLPGELEGEVRTAGFEDVAVLAIEGVGEFVPEVGEWLDDPVRRGVLLRAIERVEVEPSLLGASPHLLAVARAGG